MRSLAHSRWEPRPKLSAGESILRAPLLQGAQDIRPSKGTSSPCPERAACQH